MGMSNRMQMALLSSVCWSGCVCLLDHKEMDACRRHLYLLYVLRHSAPFYSFAFSIPLPCSFFFTWQLPRCFKTHPRKTRPKQG